MALKKKIKILAILIIIIALILAALYFIIVNYMKISYNSVVIGPVNSKITINRTSHGLPTINVSSIDDLYFALGYCHAKDRLNLMEHQRAIAIGSADKIIKEDGVFLNNLSRTIGFTRKAIELKKNLHTDQLNLIEKYCSGINYIRQHEKYTSTLRRDWYPEDVLAVLIMKEWANSFLNNTELLINLNTEKSSPKIKNLLKSNYLYLYENENYEKVVILRRIKDLISKNIGPFNNGFAIGIDKKFTKNFASGIVAYSYDSSTEMYPDIYPVNIKLNDSYINAITSSGLPFIFSFKNNDFSVYSFNLKSNSQKFYLLKTSVKDNTPHYITQRGLKEFIPTRIPDFIDSAELSFNLNWETDFGPIISNVYDNSLLSDKIISIDSILPDISYIDLLFRAPFISKPENLKNLLRKIECSPKTFLIQNKNDFFISVSGEFFPPERNQRVFNTSLVHIKPSRAWYYNHSVNIPFTGSDVTDKNILGQNLSFATINNKFRNESIKNQFKKRRVYDIEHLRKSLYNSDSQIAGLLLPHVIKYLETSPLTSARLSKIYYSNWNLLISRESIAPTIFYSSFFYGIIETLKDDMAEDADFNFKSIHLLTEQYLNILKGGNFDIFDNINTEPIETREAIYDKAFLFAIRELSRKLGPEMEKWEWGSIYKSHFRIPNLDKSIFFSFARKSQLPFAGNFDTVYNSIGNYNLKPETVPSLIGIFDKSRNFLRFNFGYSTSLFSDFFYWKKSTKTIDDIAKENLITKTVISSNKQSVK